MNQRSFSRQLAIVCILLTVAISGLFFLDRASANADLSLNDLAGESNISRFNTPATTEVMAYVPMSFENGLAWIDILTHTTLGSLDLAQYGCYYPRLVRPTPDSNELYITCEDSRNIIVLETSTLSLVGTINRPASCNQDVTFVQLGSYALASGDNCEDGSEPIDVIDTTTYTIVQSIDTANYKINAVTAHPTLPLAYAGGTGGMMSGAVLVINTTSFSVETSIPHGWSILDVLTSPDGQWLYASDYFGYGVAKIDVDTNTIVDTLPGYYYHGLEISPDGSVLYSSKGSNNTVSVADTETMDLITSIDVGVPNFEIELTGDGRELYVASVTTDVPVIDTLTYIVTYNIPIPHEGSGYGIAICPPLITQGVFLAPPSQSEFAEAGETLTYTLQLLNQTGETDSFDLGVLPGNTWTTTLSTTQVGPIADGESITFTAWVDVPPSAQPGESDTATIQATSVASPTLVATATLTTTILSDHLAYVTNGSDNILVLIDTQSHTTIGSIGLEQFGCGFPDNLSLNPGGTELWVACENTQNIIVLNTNDLSLIAVIDHPMTCNQDVAFTPTGEYALATSSMCYGSGQIDLIDTATHTIIDTISTEYYGFASIATHPYLPLAYAGGFYDGGTGYVYVIDIDTFSVQATIPVGYYVNDVTPSPDGQWVFASVTDYGVAKIDVNTNTIVDGYITYDVMFDMSISPDSSTLYVSVPGDSTIWVMDVDSLDYLTSTQIIAMPIENELTCDGSELFMATDTTIVSVMDTQTYSVIHNISIPGSDVSFSIAVCAPNVMQGAFINPPTQNMFATPAETIAYSFDLLNLTGLTDSFDLQVLPGNTWTTTFSTAQIGPIADGESMTFTAWVEVPPTAQPGESDTATILATSVNSPTVYSSTATLTTFIPGEEVAYVPMSEANSLALIDTQTHGTFATLDVAQCGCEEPRRARLSPDGTELYVTCEYSDNIIVLQTADLSLVAVINRPGVDQQDVAFIELGAYALASSGAGIYQLDVIDTETHAIVQSIPLPDYGIMSLAAHPFLPVAYAAGYYDGGLGVILVIDTQTFSIQTVIGAGYNANDVQPSRDGQWVYASSAGYGVAKIDAFTNTIVDFYSANGGYGLAISLDGSVLYLSDGWYNQVSIIDADTMDFITSVYTGEPTFENELTCDGSELYVAQTADSVPVIDTQTNNLTYDIDIPDDSSGYGIAVCPQYLAQGALLSPVSQNKFAGLGETVTYGLQMFNLTGLTDSFELEVLPGNAWITTLSTDQVGPIEHGGSVTFTVSAEVPVDALPGDSDTATIQATSVTSPSISAVATITTLAIGDEVAYVTLQDYALIAVVDTATQTVIESIDTFAAGCNGPWRATLSPLGDFVYVGCYYTDSVLVIDTATNSVVTNIPGIIDADDVTFTRSGAYALAGSRWNNQIAVIDTATNSIVQYISTPSYPRSLAMHPDLDLAYATSGNGEILVIDTNTFTIIDSIYVGGNPWDVAVSPDGNWVFAGDRDGSGLWVIDVATNSLYTTVTGVGEMTGLEVSGNGAYIYAGGLYSEVWVIDGFTFSPITSIGVNNAAWELALTCDGSQLYVGNATNEVAVMDALNFSLVDYIPMPGGLSRGIAICPENSAQGGIYLSPPSQVGKGGRGETVVYQEELYNNSGTTDSFNLEGIDYLWDTQLSTSQVGPLADGESAIFTISVTVPTDASWYDTDSVTILATGVTSPALTAEAELTTMAFAPAQINIQPASLESTQLIGEVTTQTLTINNGEGVTLTYHIVEGGAYLGKVASLGMNEPSGSTVFNDQSGYENHATCSGDACPTAGVSGAFGTALSFDGIDDYIEIAHNPEFDEIEDQDKVSLAAWVWIDEWYNGYSFDILNQGDAWSFHLEYYAIFFMTQYMQMATCNYSFNLQEWYHVAITYDRSLQEILFYVNGSLACSEYFASDIVDDNDDPMYIGHSGLYSNDYANGKIDELNIFNRAISTEEVTALYQGGLSSDVPWLSVEPTSGSVPTNGSAPVQVTFDATGLQPDIYTTTLSVNSNDPMKSSLSLPVTMTVVEQQAGVEITPTDPGQSGSPGETVVYTFTLTNLGNLADSFTLEVSSTWAADLSADSTGELGPGETFIFTLMVSIPPEAEDLAHDVALITATSANDPQVSAEVQAMTIAVVSTHHTYLPLVAKN